MFESAIPVKVLDELNAPKPFAEFPKMLHHPDGRNTTVNSAAEESALSDDWLNSPGDAAELKVVRDKRAAEALSRQVAEAVQAKQDEIAAAVAAARAKWEAEGESPAKAPAKHK